jgi:hypothetical protein
MLEEWGDVAEGGYTAFNWTYEFLKSMDGRKMHWIGTFEETSLRTALGCSITEEEICLKGT